jgi:predicted TIM-barrel fold metal-dependent hydrolase
VRILDTHLHLIYQDRLSYPWLAGVPRLNRQWTAESYFAEADALGIEQAIHMEVDVAEPQMLAETEAMLAIHPRVIAAIANGRPEHESFPAYLDQLDALGGKVKGVRRLLQGQPPELSATPSFIANIRRLPAHRLSFDICVKSHELDVAKQLIAACPDVQFILDHCGNPRIAEGEWDSWSKPLAEIAAMPNVVCKVSGILANVDAAWTVAQLTPYVEHVIASFGWDRVVWGSDHPVVTLFADLTRWVNATTAIIAKASDDEKAALLYGNAERIYRLQPAGKLL